LLDIKLSLKADMARIAKMPSDARAGLERGLVASAMEIEARARMNVQDNLNTTGRATGTLAASIFTAVDRGNLTATIGTPSVYGRIQEQGGVIKPVNGQFLTFQVGDGGWRRCTQVTIPARPYLEPAMEQSKPFIEEALIKPLRNL
jgi:HK97 gp10 family phage protein